MATASPSSGSPSGANPDIEFQINEALEDANGLATDLLDTFSTLFEKFEDFAKFAGKELSPLAKFQLDQHKRMIQMAMAEDRIVKGLQTEFTRRKALGQSTHDMLRSVVAQEERLRKIIDNAEEWNQLTNTAKESLLGAYERVKGIHEEFTKINNDVSKLTNALSAMGMDGLSSFVQGVSSGGGALKFLSSQVKQYYKDADQWKTQNYALYGSIYQVEDAVRSVAFTGKLLQKEAREATAELMHMSATGDSLEELAKTVGDVSVETGMAMNNAARFAKQMQILGKSTQETAQRFEYIKRSANTWGLTGKHLDIVMTKINTDMYRMKGYLSDETSFKKYQENMIKIGAASQRASVDLNGIMGIMDTLNDQRDKFVLLFNSDNWVSEEDPTKLFGEMANNAADALEFLKQQPAMIREELSRDMFGMGINQLQELDKVAKETGKDLSKMTPDELDDAQRRMTSAWYEFELAIEGVKQALVHVLAPVMWVLSGFNWLLLKFNELPGPMKTVVGSLLFFGTVLLVLRGNIGSLLSPIGSLWKWIRGVGDASKQAANTTAAASKTQTGFLTAIGRDIVGFSRAMKHVDWKGMLQGVAAIMLLGAALIVLGYAAYGVPAGKMIEIAVSLVVLAFALKLFTQLAGGINRDMLKIAGAIFILGAAMIPLAYAASIVDAGRIIGMAIGIAALALSMKLLNNINPQDIARASISIVMMGGALYILSLAVKDIDSGKLIGVAFGVLIMAGTMLAVGKIGQQALPGMLMFGIGLIGVAFALQIMGKALQIAKPTDFMLLGVALLIFATIIVAAGFAMSATAPAVLLFAAVLIVVALAMLIAAVAFKMFAIAVKDLVKIGISGLAKSLSVLGLTLLWAGPAILFGATLLLIGAIILLPAMVTLVIASLIGAALMPLAALTGQGLTTLARSLQEFASVIPTIFSLPAAGGALVLGMLAIAAGMLVAAAALPAALLGWLALKLIVAAVNVLAGIDSAALAAIATMAASFAPAMASLAAGMYALIGAPYIKFRVAASLAAGGLSIIFAVFRTYAAGIMLLPIIATRFRAAMVAISLSMKEMGIIANNAKVMVVAGAALAVGMFSLFTGVMLGSLLTGPAQALGVALLGVSKAVRSLADEFDAIRQLPAIGLALAAGMAAIAAGLVLAAALVVPAMLALMAFTLIATGINILKWGMDANFLTALPVIAQSFYGAMEGIKAGMYALIGAPYFRFLAAAKATQAGLGMILGVLSSYSGAISLLPIIASSFYNAMVGIAAAIPLAQQMQNLAQTFAFAMFGIRMGMYQLIGAPYIRFVFAAGFVSAGLSHLFKLFTSNAEGIKVLPTMAEYFNKAMGAIRSGMDMVIASPAHKFEGAAKLIGESLEHILGALTRNASGAATLGIIASALTGSIGSINQAMGSMTAIPGGYRQFATDMSDGLKLLMDTVSSNAGAIDKLPALSDAICGLSDMGSNITGGQSMIDMANAVNSTVLILGDSLATYATYVENSSDRIVQALDQISTKAASINSMEINPVVKNDAIISINSDVSRQNNEDTRHRQQVEAMDGIKNKLSALVELLQDKLDDQNASKILHMLNEYLPLMAEGADTGLASAVNKWNTGVG